MTQRLFSKRVFWQAPVIGLAVSGPVSSAFDLRMGMMKLENLLFVASSVASNPNVAFYYAMSMDGVTWGSFADNAALLATMSGLANPQGIQNVSLSNIMAPWIRFSVSGWGSNPADTLVTADVWIRGG